MLRILAAIALVAIPLFISQQPAVAQNPYEVWTIDQADAARGGAKLYIYRGEELEGNAYSGTPEVVDLHAAATGVWDGPGVRPHLVLFNSTHSHAIIANVASGHVYVMRAADRRIVTSIKVGVQAHAAYPTPDDKWIIVANQNGKRLARISSDYVNDWYEYDTNHDLNLGALENPNNPDNAPICPVLFPTPSKAYVTVRGGGLYVADISATPIRVVASFPRSQIAPSGCGGIVAGSRVYVNSGAAFVEGAQSSDLYVFDGVRDQLLQHIPYTPIGRDGHGMAMVGRFLWMGHRQSGNITVLDTNTNVNIANFPIGAAPDIMDVSPTGGHVFVAMRGPNNLTGGPPAKGVRPGIQVVRVDLGGASGTPALFVPIGDGAADTPVDPHSVAVRRVW